MELRRPNPNTNIQLPPGFRFHPSDEELIVHYLKNKALSRPVPASIVADIDLYKYNPWELPMKALFGEDEWYFFTPRDRKYPNGSRPNRAAVSGYWKATGTDKPILTSSGLQSIGVKKALVFYKGSPPKGTKTNWIMHEYRLLDSMIKPSKSRGSMRLDDCVLCRVRQKDNLQRSTWESAGQNNSDTVVNKPNFGFMEMADHGETLSINSSCAEPSFEIVANYLINNDCPLLACILASHQGVPGRIIEQSITDQYSNLNFQGGSSSTSTSPDQQKQYYCYSSVLEDKSEDVGSSQITDHSNSLKRKIKSNINIDGYHELPGSSYENIVMISSPTKKQEGIRNSSVFSFSDDQQYYLPVQDHSIFNPNASNKIPFMGRDELQ